MKKLVLISACALILSACSTSNQISITKSRYGNGVGISFGDGISKTEQAEIDHKREVIRDRAQHKRFIQNISLTQRGLKVAGLPNQIAAKQVDLESNEIVPANFYHSQTIEAVDASKKSAVDELSLIESKGIVETSKKALKKQIRSIAKEGKKGLLDSDVALLILVILAFILPPLAVYLFEGSLTSRFWLSLILSLLFWVPGIIYALIVILGG